MLSIIPVLGRQRQANLSSRPALFTEKVLGWPGQCTETKTKRNFKKIKKTPLFLRVVMSKPDMRKATQF